MENFFKSLDLSEIDLEETLRRLLWVAAVQEFQIRRLEQFIEERFGELPEMVATEGDIEDFVDKVLVREESVAPWAAWERRPVTLKGLTDLLLRKDDDAPF